MKDYNKFIKDEVELDSDFRIIKNGRKCTIKLLHIASGKKYSIHPGDKAINPLKSWMKKQKYK